MKFRTWFGKGQTWKYSEHFEVMNVLKQSTKLRYVPVMEGSNASTLEVCVVLPNTECLFLSACR